MLKIFLKILKNYKYKAGAQLSLIRSTRLIRRMLHLKDCKVGLSLILLSNLDHIYGPKYLVEIERFAIRAAILHDCQTYLGGGDGVSYNPRRPPL